MAVFLKYIYQFVQVLFLPAYFFSWMLPKNKKVVVVGEWKGRLNNDNAECFGNTIEVLDKTYRVYYIFNRINSRYAGQANYLYKYSLKSICVHLVAGVFVVGSGKQDVLKFLVTSRSTLFNVWHGIPIKKIHFFVKQNGLLLKLRDRFIPFFCERPDYILANAGFEAIMSEAFRPKKDIYVMPQPRWRRVGRSKNEADIILYSPTFRDHDLGFFPISPEHLGDLDRLLENIGQRMVVTLHPACTFTPTKRYSRILFNGIDTYQDIYEDLLTRAKLVISDISSILIDADELGISWFSYFPDREQYMLQDRPVFSDVFEKYCGECVSDINDRIARMYEAGFFDGGATLARSTDDVIMNIELSTLKFLRECASK